MCLQYSSFQVAIHQLLLKPTWSFLHVYNSMLSPLLHLAKQPPSSRWDRGCLLPGPSVATTAPLRQKFRSPPHLPSLLYQTLLVLWIDVLGWKASPFVFVPIFCPFSRKEHTDLSSQSYFSTFSHSCCCITSCKRKLWCWLLTTSPLHLRLYCPWADNLENPKILPFKQGS